MNAIRATRALNQRELDSAVPPSASWHVDYRDTAHIYIGGLPTDLSEGDIITIFSQYGNPTHLNLVREKETGKSRGFAFLKYEDQRSCDLAVDNLGGAEVLGRVLRVDHSRYKKREGEDEDTWRIERLENEGVEQRGGETETESGGEDEERRRRKKRRVIRGSGDEGDLLAIREKGEEEDPMREYLQREREREKEKDRKHKHRHHHRHSRRDRDGDGDGDEGGKRSRRHRDDGEDRDEIRKHHDRGRDGDEDVDMDVDGDRNKSTSRRSRGDKDREQDKDDRRHDSRRERDQDSKGDRHNERAGKHRRRSLSPEDRDIRRRERSQDREYDRPRRRRDS